MTSAPDGGPEEGKGQTNGLAFLKHIWNISDKTTRHEKPPTDVNTDIYQLPATSRRIPQRSRPRSP